MAATLLTTAVKSAAGPSSGVSRAVNKLPPARTNVSSTERWLSLAAGGTIAGFCLAGRTPPVLSTILGTGLIYRALSGNCPCYQMLGISTSDATAEQSVIAADHGTKVEHAITVNKPVSEV